MFMCSHIWVSHSSCVVCSCNHDWGDNRVDTHAVLHVHAIHTHTHTQMIGGLAVEGIIVKSCLTNPPHIKWWRVCFTTVSFSKTELDRAWYVETEKRFQSAITPLQVNTHFSLLSAFSFFLIGFWNFQKLFLWYWANLICSSGLVKLIVQCT